MIETLLLYLTIMLISLGLCYTSLKQKSKVGINLAYFILILLSVFRFDIGNDYDSYAYVINLNARHLDFANFIPLLFLENKEPLFYIFTYIFQNTTYPYIWVLGIYSIMTFLFLYKTFEENECHLEGILILFISEMLFTSWDQVRQGLAIAIFIYSIKFIKDKNILMYLAFMFLAIISHYSALLILPFYFVNKIKPKKYIYIAIIMLLAIADFGTNYFQWIYFNIISKIPYFDTNESSATLVQILSSGYKFRIIFYSIVWSIIIYFLPENERVLSNIIFFGAIIFILASGALNVMRIGNYLTFSMVLSIPIILKIKNAKLIMRIMVFGLFLFFLRDIITDSNTRGCVPYESIFSKNFSNQIFK